ncbi:hypothetical protein HD806DRAFT_386422 [Xylariaceae sp. AK1471]|nr:hypothetical protein HD806DRAFT_386422 [Xylariaceae sp. AK1471]
MSLSDFSAKRSCLRVLLWSGLLFSSLCNDAPPPPGKTTTELLVIGPPPPVPTSTTTSTSTSTITITTTIVYKPSLIPGDSRYALLGCYSQPTGNGARIFGADEHDACSDQVPPDNLTIDVCLGGCGSVAPPSNGTRLYMYAGLRNGSECICGIQLSTDAHKLSNDDCITPCSGDPRLSCGGQDNVAIYSLISGDGTNNQTSLSSGSNSRGSSSNKTGSSIRKTTPTTTPTTKPSSTTDTKGKGKGKDTVSQTAEESQTAHHATLPPSVGPGAPPRPVSTPTIAAITGSFSGAILVAAGLFLCFRAHKRKKRVQDAHVKAVLERRGQRPVPNPILTNKGDIHDITDIGIISRYKRENEDGKGNGKDSGSGTNDNHLRDDDLVPTTPALESGGKYPGGLHARTPAFAMASGPRTAADERDTLYSTLMGEVRSGPADPQPHAAGASSAVQWRHAGSSSSVPSTPAHNRTASSSGVAAPLPSAKIDSLGERAWHRRKLSTPYRPPQSAGLGIGIGAGSTSGKGRGNIASGSPPSGPPNVPLPPTPLSKPGAGARARPQSRSQSRSKAVMHTGNGQQGMNRPPLRPRRSFDTTVFEPEPGHHSSPETGAGASSKGRALGMSLANANMSTPSLGRYGSISRRPTVDSFVESPVLGRLMSLGGGGVRGGEGTSRDDDRQPTIPVLPPIAPGERFDHKRWRGTVYADSNSESERRERERGRQISASSVGTSILFSPQEFDRRL